MEKRKKLKSSRPLNAMFLRPVVLYSFIGLSVKSVFHLVCDHDQSDHIITTQNTMSQFMI